MVVVATLGAAACFGDDRGTSPTCGDGRADPGEGCDDGNTADGDGCSAACEVETDNPVCGNAVREVGEDCDDGNTADGDGCSAQCEDEVPGAECGNAEVETGEDCDDGNTASLDGCSATCRTEPLRTLTVSQNTDPDTVVASNSRACRYNTTGMPTAENHYYRAFRLSEHGIAGDFDLDAVNVGVDIASSSTGTTQTAQLRVYRYNNPSIGVTLVESDLEQLASAEIDIRNADAGDVVAFPIDATIPAGSTFVVEVATPDYGTGMPGAGTRFFIGSNAAGQARAAYMKMPASGCDRPVPESIDVIGWTSMHVVLTATGKAY